MIAVKRYASSTVYSSEPEENPICSFAYMKARKIAKEARYFVARTNTEQ